MAYLTRLFIDLDLDATPIAGYITTDNDARRPFHGWLELSSAIEERRTAGRRTAALTGRATLLPSPDSDSPQTSRQAPHPRGRASGAFTSEAYRAVRHPGPAGGLAECSTQPRWMLLGAWACAGWSAVGVLAVAATRHAQVLAWWALGLLAILVLLTFLWTEQHSTVDPDNGDQPPDRAPSAPLPHDGSAHINWSLLEREMLAQTGDEFDDYLVPGPSRSARPALPLTRAWGSLTNAPKRLLILPALAVIAFFAIATPSALAAQSLTGETFSGAGPTTGGSTAGSCPNRSSENGFVGFNAVGTVTGPYPGSFSENGTFSLSGYRNPPWTIRFSASFTITSGTTTITGSFSTAPHAWWGVGFICNSTGGVAGYSVSGPVTYTATINGQKFQGTGSISATLYAQSGARDSVSESVTMSYGQITGTAIDRATSAPIAGICVQAYNGSGGVLASAQTNSSGAYTLSSVPAGSAQVGFSSGCSASNYQTQYYKGKPSLASADPVGVTAGATTPGVNAAMVPGGQISGTVTDSATKAALAGICVQAFDSSGGEVASTQTNSSGVYTLSALPTGSYHVGFADCTAGPDNAGTYVTQYYKGKATLASADPVAVTAGTTTSGINAALVTHGEITGTVTDNATHAPLAGICLDIFDSSGGIFAQSSTNANGVYTTIPLPSGFYRVGFNLGCGDSTYVAQYYNDQATLASGNPVTVTDGTTTSGINAALVAVNGSATPPSVATGSASGVGTGSTTVSGTVSPNGTATTYQFDYGTSTNYGSQAPAPPDPSAGSGTTAQTESTTLTGLIPNTLYHYRIEATNAGGTSDGADQTFTTTEAGTSPTPIVATGSALNVGTFGPGSATVSGTVNANGEAATYGFDYGTSTNYTSQTISEPISSTTAEFVDAGLTGLSPNTVYHYRIEATDAWGTNYGADQTFTTKG